MLIDITKPIISDLSLLKTFNDVSVLINHKATTCCLDDMFYTLSYKSRNPVYNFLLVCLHKIINKNNYYVPLIFILIKLSIFWHVYFFQSLLFYLISTKRMTRRIMSMI
jgi:hypothetical protein